MQIKVPHLASDESYPRLVHFTIIAATPPQKRKSQLLPNLSSLKRDGHRNTLILINILFIYTTGQKQEPLDYKDFSDRTNSKWLVYNESNK